MMCSRYLAGVRIVKNQLSLLGFRHVSSLDAKPELISKSLSFRPAFDSKIAEEKRPLVLIYSWLDAKAHHIFKYGDFYLGKGFDVLHIKVELMQLIRPLRAHGVVLQVLEFLQERRPLDDQPVLVHGFSAGGYMHGEALFKILTEPEKYGTIGKRTVGQIFDSVVDFEGVSKGFSEAATPNRPAQLAIQSVIDLYLKITQKYTVKYHARSSKYFRANDLRTPTLFLYSRDDPISVAERIELTARQYQERGIPTFMKGWARSEHVKHFHHHPVEYIQTLNMFLETIGLPGQERAAKVEWSQQMLN